MYSIIYFFLAFIIKVMSVFENQYNYYTEKKLEIYFGNNYF